MSRTYQALYVLLLVWPIFSQIQYQGTLSTKEGQKLFFDLFCSGCNRTKTQCLQNIKNVAILPQANHFNLSDNPIIDNPLNISEIDIYTIDSKQDYRFPAFNLTGKSVKSLVMTPLTDKLKGIILYFHPTVFSKENKPSSLGNQYLAIGALYCSQGYAFVCPDYLGYGADPMTHPYVVFPQQQARTGISVLNFLAGSFFQNLFPQNTLFEVFTAGYSEGSSYSIWVSKCLQFPKQCKFFNNLNSSYLLLSSIYKYMKATGSEGAYDLQYIVRPFLLDKVGPFYQGNPFMARYQPLVNEGKPGLSVLAVLSFVQYQKNDISNISQYFTEKFFSMTCTNLSQSDCLVRNQQYNLLTVLSANASDALINLAITNSAFAKSNPNYKTLYVGQRFVDFERSPNNSIRSLVDNYLLNDIEFQDAMIEASIVDFASRTLIPTFLFSLRFDSLVSPVNTINFLAAGKSNDYVSGYYYWNDDHLVCNYPTLLGRFAVDHIRAEALANIFALAFIDKD